MLVPQSRAKHGTRKFSSPHVTGRECLSGGWPRLDRRDAPECGPHAVFRGFAHGSSNSGHPTVIFRTTGECATETRSVSEGPRVDSGGIVTCGESGVPRSRFGFPENRSRSAVRFRRTSLCILRRSRANALLSIQFFLNPSGPLPGLDHYGTGLCRQSECQEGLSKSRAAHRDSDEGSFPGSGPESNGTRFGAAGDRAALQPETTTHLR